MCVNNTYCSWNVGATFTVTLSVILVMIAPGIPVHDRVNVVCPNRGPDDTPVEPDDSLLLNVLTPFETEQPVTFS